MKIGFLYGLDIHEASSGGTVHGFQLAQNLKRQGHQLFTWYWTDPLCDFLTHFRGRQVRQFLNVIDALYVRLEWSGNSAWFPLIKYLSLKKIPVIWEINGTPTEICLNESDKDQYRRIVQRLRGYAKFVDGAVTVTDGIGEFARQELGIERVRTIPNGTDPTIFFPEKKAKSPDSPLVVVWLGSTGGRWHDFPRLIEAAEILHSQGAPIEFWIIGDPERLPKSLPNNIIKKGMIKYRLLSQTLNLGDVGLHITKPNVTTDFSPLKVFDYMGCGLAIGVNQYGQCRDFIETWDAGFYIGETAEELAEILSLVSRDRARISVLGSNGRRAVEKYYNWARVSDDLVSFMSDLGPKA